MCKAVMNSLFARDRKKYNIIRKKANSFISNYAGSTIIQDDIFHVAENYVLQHDAVMELLHYPLNDDDFCACTFIRDGRVFVVINADIPLSKQIFAMAHELYHLYNYFEDCNMDYQEHGSILETSAMDNMEDAEANAFAGAVLAPGISIIEQMDIFLLQPDSLGIREILTLMEIFAIPFKAVVLRLFEEGIITKEQVNEFFQIPDETILHQIKLTGRAMRWQRKTTKEILFGSLLENMERAKKLDAVPEDRLEEDTRTLETIREIISRKNEESR